MGLTCRVVVVVVVVVAVDNAVTVVAVVDGCWLLSLSML